MIRNLKELRKPSAQNILRSICRIVAINFNLLKKNIVVNIVNLINIETNHYNIDIESRYGMS